MPAKKEPHTIPAEKIATYEKLISEHPDIERKGATMPYTSLNGNMFSFFAKDGSFNLRLPEKELSEIISKHGASASLQYGTILKEYTLVPESVFLNKVMMKKYFAASVAYARLLKPKPTKRRK